MIYQKYIPCYCGGFVKCISKQDKRLKQGWKWVIKNCYPSRGTDILPQVKGL